LPADIFAAGQAHWLGVQVEGEAYEQPRVLLLSVPYALKAGDAQTLGGMPASAFMLAAPPMSGGSAATPETAVSTSNASISPATTSDVTTSGGTENALPLFSTATNIQNSLLTQTGTSAINVGGKLNLPTMGTATSSVAFNSRPLDFVASEYDSSTSAPVEETFQWQGSQPPMTLLRRTPL
jgi:trimeric autotransporter adhesin